MKTLSISIKIFFIILIFAFNNPLLIAQDSIWQKVDDGLFIGEFLSPVKSIIGDSKIAIVKIDPNQYNLKLLCADELKQENLTVKEWVEKYNLIAAMNAGMFLEDFKSNVGYMRNYDYVNNIKVSPKYLSVSAFNPIAKSNEPFKIFDIDEMDIKKVKDEYQTVIQNLRLIKNPAENRWSKQNRKWSEAALGQDKEGNVLFVFSRSPYSMFEFNNILINLSIDIVNAQHLEGGPEASLYFFYNNIKIELWGSYETNFNENDSNESYWPIPNVLGIMRKE